MVHGLLGGFEHADRVLLRRERLDRLIDARAARQCRETLVVCLELRVVDELRVRPGWPPAA